MFDANILVIFDVNRYRRNNSGLEQAIIGTELLRLTGGPNRGWYPTRKANQPRPASIEHLERLNNAYDPRLAASGDQRKPLTLPTNITPNKYFGQSKHSSASSTREALRRVTSLLIKKGKRWNLRYYKSRRSWNQRIDAAIPRPLENTMSTRLGQLGSLRAPFTFHKLLFSDPRLM